MIVLTTPDALDNPESILGNLGDLGDLDDYSELEEITTDNSSISKGSQEENKLPEDNQETDS